MKDDEIIPISIKQVREMGYDSDNYIDPKSWIALSSTMKKKEVDKVKRLYQEDDVENLLNELIDDFFFELSRTNPYVVSYVISRGTEFTNMRTISSKSSDSEQMLESTNNLRILLTSFMLDRLGFDKNTPKKLRRFMNDNKMDPKKHMIPQGSIKNFKKDLKNHIFSGDKSHFEEMNEEMIQFHRRTLFDLYFIELCKALEVEPEKINEHPRLKEKLGGFFDDYLRRKKKNPHTPRISSNLISEIFNHPEWKNISDLEEHQVIKGLGSDYYINPKTDRVQHSKVLLSKIDKTFDERELEHIIRTLRKHRTELEVRNDLSDEEKKLLKRLITEV